MKYAVWWQMVVRLQSLLVAPSATHPPLQTQARRVTPEVSARFAMVKEVVQEEERESGGSTFTLAKTIVLARQRGCSDFLFPVRTRSWAQERPDSRTDSPRTSRRQWQEGPTMRPFPHVFHAPWSQRCLNETAISALRAFALLALRL